VLDELINLDQEGIKKTMNNKKKKSDIKSKPNSNIMDVLNELINLDQGGIKKTMNNKKKKSDTKSKPNSDKSTEKSKPNSDKSIEKSKKMNSIYDLAKNAPYNIKLNTQHVIYYGLH
jgi:uncharacterized small protein (DUF1192 family)